MDLLDTVKLVLDEALGNRGAVRNCQVELRKRQEIDQVIHRLTARVPMADHGRGEGQASA